MLDCPVMLEKNVMLTCWAGWVEDKMLAAKHSAVTCLKLSTTILFVSARATSLSLRAFSLLLEM